MKICFFIGIFQEWLDAADTMKSIREHYPDADIIAITDGTHNPEFRDRACLKYRALYFAEDNIRSGGQSPGLWIERWMQICLYNSNADLFFKIDPDTDIIRRLAFYPETADVFGCSYGSGFKKRRIQGGFEGIKRSAVNKILSSGVLSDPLYWSQRFGTKRMTAKYMTKILCESAVFSHAVHRCGLSWFEHPEIFCATKLGRDFNAIPYAVIHPKKWKLKAEIPLWPPVFGIGLSKTGTTSLNEALNILGYKSVHYPWDSERMSKKNAATDITVALRYRELAEKYPDARFIITVRDIDDWLISIERHLNRVPFNKMRSFPREHRKIWIKRITGAEYNEKWEFNRQHFITGYNAWLDEVRKFFYGEGRLLELNLCGGDGWDKLCPFLMRDIPDCEFPHKNRTVTV